MIRTNKKTRMKGLPPKIQLQLKDAVTGSFPAISRAASDNRTGMYRTFWDDNNTINFGPRDDIRNSIINYYRFNSGSSYGEIFSAGTSAGTSSYTIKPVWSTNSTITDFQNDDTVNLHFQMHSTGAIAGFSGSIPFSGSGADVNNTSLRLTGSNYSFATGSLSVFDPGSQTRISGTNEKPFSVSFWAKVSGSGAAFPQVMLSVAGGSTGRWASYALAVLSTSLAFATNNAGAVQFLLSDSGSNALVLSTSNAVLTPNTWKHVVFTYDGLQRNTGMKLYIDGQFITTGNNSQGTPSAYAGMATTIGQDIVTVGTIGRRLGSIFNGNIDELIFFNEELTSKTAGDLYRSTAGIHRPNSGNPFANGIYLGAGISTKSSYFANSNIADLITDFSTSLYQSSGSRVVKGIGDNLAHFTPGQSLTPFNDSGNFASDGKSTNNVFFATGSATELVGAGFDEPLWAKTKIEIDLSANTSTAIQNFCGGFYSATEPDETNTIAYYNFATKNWTAISNKNPQNYSTTNDTGYVADSRDTLAFTPSFMTYENGIEPGGKGTPTTSFGFPFSTKYAASDAQVLHMSGIISAPFLVEKIVLDFSASFQFSFDNAFQANKIIDIDSSPIAYSSSYAVTNFFILNQRQYYLSSSLFYAGGFDGTNPVYFADSIPKNQITTIRDIVGWGSIASFNNAFGWATTALTSPDDLYGGRWKRDLNIIDAIGTDATSSLWTGRYFLSFSAGLPNRLSDTPFTFSDSIPGGLDPKGLGVLLYDTSFNQRLILTQNGGSNGLWVTHPSGRNLTSPIGSFEENTLNTFSPAGLIPINVYEKYKKISPYILMPKDKIAFGWAAPTMDDNTFIGNVDAVSPITASVLTIAAGPSKVILYGSYIREGKEYHDTLNQLLTSNTVHEIIG